MIGICLVWASLAVSVSGPPQPAIEQVAIGVAGLYKVGHWTPVEITLTGAARPWHGRVRLRVTDGNGVPSVYEDTPCELPAGQSNPARDLCALRPARQRVERGVSRRRRGACGALFRRARIA